MGKEIQTVDLNKKFFKPVEGSNYKVLMTYDRVEIIEYAHFLKLAQVLNDNQVPFVTVNDRLVNKTTIIDICPTSDKTVKQQKEKEKEIELKRIENEKFQQLEDVKRDFDVEFFDKKYGPLNWVKYIFRHNDTEKHVLTHEDYKESWVAFEVEYPAESKLLKERWDSEHKSI